MKRCNVNIMLFNEVESLQGVVDGFLGLRGRVDEDLRIVIIDDGSTDGSSEVASALAGESGEGGERGDVEIIRVVHHEKNMGLGEVYRTGFREAQRDLADYVTFFPADGQFEPELIIRYLRRMGEADLVLGYLEGGRPGIVGRGLSFVERFTYKLLFGGFPRFHGIMMFRGRLLDEISLVSRGRGWGNVMEFVLKASRRGYRISTVEITVKPRRYGRSKVNNLRSICANAIQLGELRMALWKEERVNRRDSGGR